MSDKIKKRIMLTVAYDGGKNEYRMTLKGTLSHSITLGADVFGNITRMDNALNDLAEKLDTCRAKLEDTQTQLENARAEMNAPFTREAELAEKTKQLSALNKELDIGNKDETAIMMDDEVIEEPTRNKELCR